MARVFLGLGSNLGDRRKNLDAAIEKIRRLGTVTKISSYHETTPVGFIDQPDFLNAVLELQTELTPRALLTELLKIEADLGRIRDQRWGPRTIDLDILLYDNLQINEPDLIIPHPRMKEREFVMKPLQEILTHAINNQEEMAEFAARIAKIVPLGSVIALSGDLGAGKTTFTQSFVKARGIKDDVTSPTFVIMNVYGQKDKIYHFDFYRLGSIDDLEVIGAEEFIPSREGITLIEWADKLPETLPKNTISIKIKVTGDTTREVIVEGLVW